MSQKKIKVRPGKTQSKFGFIVGIVFCIIGCVVVIPIFGPFGILWTGVAVVITVMNFKNGFSDEGVATHEIIIDESEDATEQDWNAVGGNRSVQNEDGDIEAKLKKLNSLYEQRLITSSEYEEKRKELLDKF
ncbi:MAG: SHOCT domain-containing protein [Lachnospiraceae bacterium]|nr:SHOCT domain-containing protein [Lachnospiraceae bacterium]